MTHAQQLAALIAERELCLNRMEAVVTRAEREMRIFTLAKMSILDECHRSA